MLLVDLHLGAFTGDRDGRELISHYRAMVGPGKVLLISGDEDLSRIAREVQADSALHDLGGRVMEPSSWAMTRSR